MRFLEVFFFCAAVTFLVLFLTKKSSSGSVVPEQQTQTIDGSGYFETNWNVEIPAGTQKIVITFATSDKINLIYYVTAGIDSVPSTYSFLDAYYMQDGSLYNGEITYFINTYDPGQNPQIFAEMDVTPGSFNNTMQAVYILRNPLDVPRTYTFAVNQ